MDISPIGTSAQTAPSATLTADFNSFLRLLTAQLQNQNPLDPLDANQFTEQLVSFSQVEQAIQQTSRLDQILARLSSQDLTAAASYIGREVTAFQADAALDASGAAWFYDLQANAAGARVTILDRNGLPVRQIDGPVTAGRHEIVWDGTDTSGRAMPPGIYTMRVEALTSTGQGVAANVGTRGLVTGVEQRAGEIILNLGATTVRAANIAAIAASPFAQ